MIALLPDRVWTGTVDGEGWVVRVDGDVIHSVGPRAQGEPIRALPGQMIVPGLVNAHSHAFQRAFRGHVQWTDRADDDFWAWRARMYEVADALDPDGVFAVSRLAFLEMIEGGVTTVGEFHYVHHQRGGLAYPDPDLLARQVVAAARDVGLRICLLRVAYARGAPGVPLSRAQLRFGDTSPDDAMRAVERLGDLAGAHTRLGLAPHSTRAVPFDWLTQYAAFDGPIHVHVAEQPRDVAGSVAEHGCGPIEVLRRAGLLDPRLCAVHLTWPSDGDADLVRDAGASVCVCPGTELDLGDGFLPLPLRDGVRLCVGTDSHARIDVWEEARALELHGRGLAGRRIVLGRPGERHGVATRILTAATLEGDRALGGRGAGLEPGAPADFVVLDLDRPAAAGVPPLEAAALVADPSWVDSVWVGGVEVVTNGRHPRRAAIVRDAVPWLCR